MISELAESAGTKRRILFVDDEQMILDMLAMAVRTHGEEWETSFANSGAEALELLDRTPFDVVVSDMRMPGMNGAALLNEVHKRHPGSIRLILSGFADQDLIMRCVGVTHQFLSKPFDVEAFCTALTRITGLKERLHSREVQQLVAAQRSLPPLPAVYFKISQALEDPECPIERIGEIISTDPALTAKILQLANSAFFGFGREVCSAYEAVMMLGVGTIRSLVLALSLFSTFETQNSVREELPKVWNHSLRVGCLARKILELEDLDEQLAQQAFTGGLLHDIGKLILATLPAVDFKSMTARAAEEGRPMIEIEREVLKLTHADVAAYLLDLWGLPSALVEIVAFHHNPTQLQERALSAAIAVHAANVFAQEADPGIPILARNLLDSDYMRQLGLGSRIEVWRKELAGQCGT